MIGNGEDADTTICISRYDAINRANRAEYVVQISRIFFAASSVQSFRDDGHRAAFHWLWLGRYLAEEPTEAFVALYQSKVCGYLVGSLADPAQREEFKELSYFQDFADETARFPAHLHINVDEDSRGMGVGARLVDRFVDHSNVARVSGVHVVTGAGMRNVGFYQRLGFNEVARAPRNGSAVVMLAKKLGWKDH